MQIRMSLTKLFLSEGGYFKAHLDFPKEYPQRPPKMKFVTDMWHPNGEQQMNNYTCTMSCVAKT